MRNFVTILLATLPSISRSRAALELENLALRHQIGDLQRSVSKRVKLTPLDHLLWAWLSGIWSDWRSALVMVQPETVIAWHRRGFGRFWRWKIRRGQPSFSGACVSACGSHRKFLLNVRYVCRSSFSLIEIEIGA